VTLAVKNVTFAYGEVPVLRSINLEVENSIVVGLIGPNAAGKSTFLKCLSGVCEPEGTVNLRGNDMLEMPPELKNDRISYLPQSTTGNVSLTVFECVLLGQLNQLSWHVSDSRLARVTNTLEQLNISHLASRSYGELSGGQKQMVGIAQALVESPELFLLDEPTAGLDLNHRLRILELVRKITREKQIISILALHDLNLAGRFADQLLVLNDGAVYDRGSPKKLLSAKMLREVYGVRAEVEYSENGDPFVRLKGTESRRSNSGGKSAIP